MSRLAYILNALSVEGQVDFQMEAVPGRHTQVIVGGSTLAPGEYFFNGPTLTLVQAPEAGVRVLVISGQGGTFVTGEYVQSLVADKATKTEVSVGLANKINRNEDVVLPRDPIDPLGAATKQMVDGITPGVPQSYVDERFAKYMPRTEIEPALANKLDTSMLGQPNGVGRLGPDGRLLEFQFPNIAISEVRTANSEAEMLDIADEIESGDVVRRLDTTPRRSFMRNRVVADITSTIDDLFVELTDPTAMDANSVFLTPAGNLGSTNVEGALYELQSDIDNTNDRVTSAEALITGLRTDLNTDIANLNTHASLAVDPASTDTVRDKHVSNEDLRMLVDNMSTSFIGEVKYYVGTTDPNSKFMILDGRVLDRVVYGDLFNWANTNGLIGSVFGIGDGATTFILPDARGRTVVGAGMGVGLTDRLLGSIFGDEAITLLLGQMPTHNHVVSLANAGAHSHGGLTGYTNPAMGHNHVAAAAYDGSNVATSGSGRRLLTMSNHPSSSHGNTNTTNPDGTHTHTVSSDGDHTHTATVDNSGNSESHSNMQPGIALNVVMRVVL